MQGEKRKLSWSMQPIFHMQGEKNEKQVDKNKRIMLGGNQKQEQTNVGWLSLGTSVFKPFLKLLFTMGTN